MSSQQSSGTSCSRAGCVGAFAADGYCDTCGTKQVTAASASRPPFAAAAASGGSCTRSGCVGSFASDGYCDTCGLKAAGPAASHGGSQASMGGTIGAPSIAAAVAPGTSARLSSRGMTSRRSAPVRTGSVRGQLGVGLIELKPTPAGDPAAAVMSQAKIAETVEATPEEERFCRSCDREVGRASGDKPGRIKGFCSNCRTQFDFATNAPVLVEGDLVAGQYEVLGPIAHGGMGWIYLGRDKAVSDRWVVLKGLLNSEDPDAALAAVAERQFLAQIEHANIVNIYNFATHAGAGYIVMEYVGGESLNQKLKTRRKANGGSPDPLPVAEAIAYIIGVLPAFGYLHSLGVVYNDLKPANIMAVGSDVKLIDVGAVMQADDIDAAIFGTQGFQAPEVAAAGPSVASDLYTVGRTLAVMILNFVFHSGTYQYALPGPDTEPLFAQWESLYRFLLKSTAPHPDDRFQSAAEMAVQLTGVLREIVAVTDRTPRATRSLVFGGDRLTALLLDDESMDVDAADWRALPRLRVDVGDASAGYLQDIDELDGSQVISLVRQGVSDHQITDTREVQLRLVRALLEARSPVATSLDRLAASDPWDWRVDWYRGLDRLIEGDAVAAADHFSRVWTEVPGELAPVLAVASAAEQAGEHPRAARLYELVVSVDATYVSAAFGLARSRAAMGDRPGAVEAYRNIPSSSATYQDAQVATARTLAAVGSDTMPAPAELAAAAAAVERLQIDAAERAQLTAEILERALAASQAGQLPPTADMTLFERPVDERELRLALEDTYRERARLVSDISTRVALVDRANAIRPKTLL